MEFYSADIEMLMSGWNILYLCDWTLDAFEHVRRTTHRDVPIEFYVLKESANVDHILELADVESKIVGFEEPWRDPLLPPDRLQVALVPRFHSSAMENCDLIIALDSPLARCVLAMR
jgi:hypothetical protein